jgi:septum formation inhibitor MinC
MSQAPSIALAGTTEDSHVEGPANVTLRGTARGLEILIAGTPTAAALGARLTELLAEAPGFFAGSNARVAIDGMLPIGALACLEQIAARFELRLVEIGPAAARRLRGDMAAMPPIPPVPAGFAEPPRTRLADSAESSAGEATQAPAGDAAAKAASAPGRTDDATAKAASVPGGTGDAAAKAASATSVPGDAAAKAASVPGEMDDAVTRAASASGAFRNAAAKAVSASDPALVAALAAVLVAAGARDAPEAPADEAPGGPRLVVGPVRSGRIVDHAGHLIVVGDVNPGAEVRAGGSIIVLGRLRGVAHAAIGRDTGCIIALSLQPQQLRIGRMVARAGDADHPSGGAEIAYVTGETIVVERFSGRLPSGLAACM